MYFSIVPPGGGEQDYGFEVDLDALPHTGDYITVGDTLGGTENFIVRRRWFNLQRSASDPSQVSQLSIAVEAEFALGPLSSASHKKACEGYANRGNPPRLNFTF